jgi:hypothetical protein
VSWPFVLALVWLVVVNVRGMFPSRDHHWRFAYGMMILGLPILGLVWWFDGVWYAVFLLVLAGWVMRWPVIYGWRWLRRRFASRG